MNLWFGILLSMEMIKNILKYTVLLGLFAIPFIPFIVPGGMFFPFIAGKGFSFRIIVEIIFGAFLVLAFIDSQYRPRFSWITKSVLLFTFITLIADLLGVNPYKSIWSNYERMEGFVLIAHLALYYLVASSVLNTRVRWNQLFTTSIFASAIMSLYALFQKGGEVAINQGTDRVDGTLGNATYLAIYLVFHIFICLYMLLDSTKPKWQKWTYGFIVLLETIVLALTATRGAILGLIGGLVFAGIMVLWKERENIFYRKLASGVLVVIVVIVGLFFTVRRTSFAQNNFILSRFTSLSFSEIKTQGRYFVWPMAIKGFVERPILGWGQENFNFVFNKYYNPLMYGQEEWFDRTHDVFLDWLVAGGLLGFIAYFTMYFALLYYIWKKDAPFKLSEKSIFTGMILAYLFHNIFVFDNLISYILFFSMLAYVHSQSAYQKQVTSRFYTTNFSAYSVKYIVFPLVALFTFGAVYFVNIPPLLANWTLIKAISPQGDPQKNLDLFKKIYNYDSFGSGEATEQLVQISLQISGSSLPDAIKKSFYEYAREKIVEKVNEVPNDARYLVFAGSFFNRFGQYDEAIKYLNRAVAQSPNKQSIYFELGTAYIGKGDLQKTFEVFKKAYDLEPNAQESKIIYTLGAIYTKNNVVLEEMSSKLSQDIVINDNRFIQAYANVGDYQMVINILTARLQKDPKNTQYKLSLASAYATIGQKQKAISLIQEIIKDQPEFKTQGEQYIKEIQEK